MCAVFPELWAWAGRHCDAFHTGSREACGHCQESIREFGAMPAPEAVWATARAVDQSHWQPYQFESVRWGSLSARWRPIVLARDGYTCQTCGATGVPLDVDHIVPLRHGGRNRMDNLRARCRPCNRGWKRGGIGRTA